ncbi:hypothetical protein FHP25_33705 [Vineibacter terrae]|uniref:DUF982 domain-containing protein n=1 Tax=Vineibacter terrae TaxID=2586908 RepID=A0A5C8PAA3_9HYPH|nr:DUF982 domain-containing protein [Vineibacter terrae]TXL70610.1 hypothetical protein FHP25_33705 [Vineibacter terrae]
MSSGQPGKYFDKPVRMRVGDGVGLIRNVEEALDWIEHRPAEVKMPFVDAAAALRRARSSGTAADAAAARSAFEAALAAAGLLAHRSPE